MKKLVYIVMPILLAVALVISGVCVIYVYNLMNQETLGVTVLDSKGNILVEAKKSKDIYEAEQWAYLEAVMLEASQIMAEQTGQTQEEALEALFDSGYQIQTVFDAQVFSVLQLAGARWGSNFPIGCSITDLNGNLLAVYSTEGEEDSVNYALEKTSPYSSFKPLSVYAPAMEAGVINWSTQYLDTKYKQVIDEEDGILKNWPQNVTGYYTGEYITAYDGLRTSVNTTAVFCLADFGVTNAIEFLQTKLSIPLTQEAYVAEVLGEDEVIGNIALGYLETGVTTADMAGYYQIFATGGSYTQPKTITQITDLEGKAVYQRQAEAVQVISPTTADLMNKMLQGVLKRGGTGTAAVVRDLAVAGKTGTGDNNTDNWFVGVTPGYSCAVWHGIAQSNIAAEIFAAIIEEVYSTQTDANRNFITHQNLTQMVYCTHSGMAFSANCTSIEEGYYASTDVLDICDRCQKHQNNQMEE